MPTHEGTPSETDVIVRQRLWSDVLARLRSDIARGALAPGTRLVEADLAQRFGVSRGPVREALRELVRAGLALDRPHRGTFVSHPAESDLEELFVLREALELAAVRLVLAKAHRDEIAALQLALELVNAAYDSDDEDALAVDLGFHRQLVRLAGSKRLSGIFEDLALQTLRLKQANERLLGTHSKMPPWTHGNLLRALLADNLSAAEAAVKAHYRYMGDRFFTIRSTRRRRSADRAPHQDAQEAGGSSSGHGRPPPQ